MATLILGLGESGLAAARWLARTGAQLRVADTRQDPPMQEALAGHLPGTPLLRGDPSTAWLEGVDRIVISPGISPHHEPVAALLATARASGVAIDGEIEVFAQALQTLRSESGYDPVLIGVTGTNGKTTTARMVAAMIARAGRSVKTAGNISPSALDALRECLDGGQLPQYWVLELSSFQLASTRTLACHAAAVLNVTEDHLDWHGSMEDYAACKARIFAERTIRILNRDDPRTMAMAADAGDQGRLWTFAASVPERPAQYGVVREGGIAWLAVTAAEEGVRRRRRRPPSDAPAADAGDPPLSARLMPLDAMRVRGLHNATNALAALALVTAGGLPLAPALRALQEFQADPHRTARIASIGGVDYYDDSKGTNVGATLAALNGLGELLEGDARIIAILGGDGKGQDFAPLASAIARHARAVVLIGRDAARIAEALDRTQVRQLPRASLEEAVSTAAAQAHPGDIVLLSPACASLDMFRNYAHRAQVFAQAVGQLTEPAQPEGAS